MIGFKVKKLQDLMANFSSFEKSTVLSDSFFSSALFAFWRASNSSNSISEELSDLIEQKGWTIAPNSRDAKVIEVIKQIEQLPEGYTLEDIIEITDDGIQITEAALEQLEDSIREAYDSIDNQDVSCTII